ncbi:MAG TPA: 4Fe-4S binding protein [Firmicutes bacterium]|nr:4Fe-4S binding protein [Bacillota bacterium]
MSVITTRVADCRDCHRCLRHCPVKAISFESGQAHVLDERCVACGTCTLVCPQHAKIIHSDLARAQDFLAQGEKVALSLAPSFPAAFPPAVAASLPARARALGFTWVEETAVGAEVVAAEYAALLNERETPLISACCPAVVNLLEKHHPELLPYLAPTLSPMTVHALLLKDRFGPEIKVVFAGPCTAKIDEARRPEVAGRVDAVITFADLKEWLAAAPAASPPPGAKAWEYRLPARSFPVSGGVLAAAGIKADLTSGVVAVSGLEECLETFADLAAGRIRPRFIEAMACRGGCVGGPVMPQGTSAAARRLQVAAYFREADAAPSPWHIPAGFLADERLRRSYVDRRQRLPEPSPAEIAAILARTGKTRPADEANCGGCGYSSCREKAYAVYQGWAEEEMCIPFMKAKISSLAGAIVDSTPSAVIVVDPELTIQEFNPRARSLFAPGNEAAQGQPLSAFLDPGDFARAWAEQKAIVDKRVAYPERHLVTLQTILPIKDYGLIVGIINDISETERRRQEVEAMKREALSRAEHVITRQMQVAQEIAGVLGETTAETKATLLELIRIVSGKEEKNNAPRG